MEAPSGDTGQPIRRPAASLSRPYRELRRKVDLGGAIVALGSGIEVICVRRALATKLRENTLCGDTLEFGKYSVQYKSHWVARPKDPVS